MIWRGSLLLRDENFGIKQTHCSDSALFEIISPPSSVEPIVRNSEENRHEDQASELRYGNHTPPLLFQIFRINLYEIVLATTLDKSLFQFTSIGDDGARYVPRATNVFTLEVVSQNIQMNRL